MKRVLRALEHLDSALGIFLILPIVFLVVAMVLGIFPPPHSRVGGNQANAVIIIRSLVLAENKYAIQNPDKGFACSFSDFSKQNPSALSGVRFWNMLLEDGTVNGYHYEIRCPQDGNQKATCYTITAVPTKRGDTGKLAFCTDQSGKIRYSESGFAAECLAIGKHVELE